MSNNIRGFYCRHGLANHQSLLGPPPVVARAPTGRRRTAPKWNGLRRGYWRAKTSLSSATPRAPSGRPAVRYFTVSVFSISESYSEYFLCIQFFMCVFPFCVPCCSVAPGLLCLTARDTVFISLHPPLLLPGPLRPMRPRLRLSPPLGTPSGSVAPFGIRTPARVSGSPLRPGNGAS